MRRQLQRFLLPLSLGLAAGIVNALSLASGAVVHGNGLAFGLAIRLAAVALITSVFTMFVAEYGQLRAELSRAERQLRFTRSGRMAAGKLGRAVAREAAAAAVLAGGASFLGAFAPLALGAAVRNHSWTALVVAVGALGALGGLLAAVVDGQRTRWVLALMLMGTLVAVAGTWLDVA